MRLTELGDAELTYCSNVHPGESLAEVEALLARHVALVKRGLSPQAPFGVGLRLAARASDELEQPGALERLKSELERMGMYVFTLNGFPYGAFHGTRVKESVYRPDWLEPERVRYTEVLARVLSGLLPSGARGSISTVPGCYKPRSSEPDAPQRMARNVALAAVELVRIERERGQLIELALEPEPHCFIETTSEAVVFFEEHLFRGEAPSLLADVCQLAPAQAEAAMRRHVGICLDTCHASVEFEAPLAVLERLESAGITVPKIQISAGLRLAPATAERRQALAAFDNEVYFHQTVVRDGERLIRFVDLPEALASGLPESSEWRVHFHVPIFHAELGAFSSTQDDLVPLLRALRGRTKLPHLEVETYTWDVLPERFRDIPVTDAIVRELRWTLEALGLEHRGERAPE